MALQIRQAKRSQARLRALVKGPSGAGKTYGGLAIGEGLGGKIVVIDSENGSSDRYDGLFTFQVIDINPPFTPEAYIEAIKLAEDNGAEVIVIDSITHEWSGAGGCLELVDKLAAAKFKGNTWSAYSEVTPRHRAFIDAMLRSKAHIIATARSKTETAQVEDGGRKKVVKLGMKAETRDGAEYEFDVVFDIVHEGHWATVDKDRTNIFGTDPHVISRDTGKRLAEWLAGATPLEIPKAAEPAKRLGWRDRVAQATTVEELGRIGDDADQAVSNGRLSPQQREQLDAAINERHAAIETEVTA
jgi:hypothetical protein